MIMSGGMAMSNYRAYKEKALQNPEVKTEYDALQAEYDIIQSLIDARANQNITQKELSLKTGIPQAVPACGKTAALHQSLQYCWQN